MSLTGILWSITGIIAVFNAYTAWQVTGGFWGVSGASGWAVTALASIIIVMQDIKLQHTIP